MDSDFNNKLTFEGITGQRSLTKDDYVPPVVNNEIPDLFSESVLLKKNNKRNFIVTELFCHSKFR